MQLAEPLLTVAGYNASSELGWISAIKSGETDDSGTVKIEDAKYHYYCKSAVPCWTSSK